MSDNLETILEKQRQAFRKNSKPDWSYRRKNLEKLGALVKEKEEDIQRAISADFGNRSDFETTLAECVVVQGGISHALKHTPKWMKERRAPTALRYMPATNRIIPQPKGVVGIISPWNYPLQLAIMPLIGALGAGNRVMIKPSEYTPRFSELLKSMMGEIFSDDEVHVAVGDVDVAQAFSELPFDHLVFTGSTQVGRFVAQAAAKNLTPCTLELGGKSPTIIDDSADMSLTVPRIAMGKLLNSGQTCVAPDYVLMPQNKIDAFSDAIIQQAETFYPTQAGNPDYTSIIADKHYARLQELLEDAENKGAKVRIAGNDDMQQLAKERKIPLTILTNVSDDMKVMQEEIFGPILPIVESPDLDHSMDYVQSRERPLALYWFGQDKAKEKKVLNNTISGGACVNEIAWHVIQEDIPFGGIGPSGMGAYHGQHGFDSLSHLKGVFKQSRFAASKMLQPPYNEKTHKVLNLMKKWI